jgi:hypothetical protein
MIAHLIASNKTDLEVCLGHLRIFKALKDMGDIRQERGVYICTLRLSKPFDVVSKSIRDRFGRFVQIRKKLGL